MGLLDGLRQLVSGSGDMPTGPAQEWPYAEASGRVLGGVEKQQPGGAVQNASADASPYDEHAEGEVWARIYPRAGGERNGDLVRNVLEAANGWRVVELRTEQGRLDEVFRSITLPETLPAKAEDK